MNIGHYIFLHFLHFRISTSRITILVMINSLNVCSLQLSSIEIHRWFNESIKVDYIKWFSRFYLSRGHFQFKGNIWNFFWNKGITFCGSSTYFSSGFNKASRRTKFTVDQSFKEKRYAFNAMALLFILCQYFLKDENHLWNYTTLFCW